MEDAALVARSLTGDTAAFDELASRHRRPALAMAIGMMGELATAEDIVQDAFAIAFEKLRHLREPEKFRSWLFTIVRRLCAKEIRRGPKETSLDRVPDPPAPGLEMSDVENQVLKAIESLPQAYRELLSARYIAEMSYEDMAALYEVPEGTVRVRVFRAKQRLRSRLASLEREMTEATRCELQ